MFLEKLEELYPQQFDTSKVEYINSRTKVELTCNSCGNNFLFMPGQVTVKQPCQKCRHNKIKSDRWNEFIESCEILHDNKYDYSQIDKNLTLNDKVDIICPIHGQFQQAAIVHKKGHGCEKCARELQANRQTYDTEKFLERFIEIHGNDYSFENTNYILNKSEVTITCPIHGDFSRSANYLLKPDCTPCRKCSDIIGAKRISEAKKGKPSKAGKFTEEQVIQIFEEFISGEYSQLDLGKKYGVRTSTISNLLNRKSYAYLNLPDFCNLSDFDFREYGTKFRENRHRPNKLETFIEKSKEIFGSDALIYDKVNYTLASKKVLLKCVKHDSYFEVIPSNHILNKSTCPICSESSGETQIRVWLQNNGINFIPQKSFDDCRHINKLLFDFYLPDHNLLIEYQGRQHYEPIEFFGGQEAFEKRKIRDSIKRNWCQTNDIDLLEIKYDDKRKFSTIFLEFDCSKVLPQSSFHNVYQNSNFEENQLNIPEDIWREKKDIILSRLNENCDRIFARKCLVKKLNTKIARKFIDQCHLQGYANSGVKLGLYLGQELVSVMTFGSHRKSLGRKPKQDHWELVRFCSKLNTRVIGGASKLLKQFISEFSPKQIISYADANWSSPSDNVYEKIGFEFVHKTKPSYRYYKDGIGHNRFKFRKSTLVKQGFDKSKTEKQIMTENGFSIIYDLGTYLYKYKCH